MTASTALEARNALATSWVAGKIESTLQTPTMPDERDDHAEEEAERRPTARRDCRIALGESPLVAVEGVR